MAYGSFSKAIVDHYNRVDYRLSGTTYGSISIFKTNPSTESIAPAIYPNENGKTTGNKQLMENMIPPGISASKVIAKCNAGSMTYGNNSEPFYGMYYVNNILYKDRYQLSGSTDSSLDNLWARDFPSFCVKTDGTANIRWPLKADLPNMLPYCSSIFSSLEPLVYNGMSIFESAVYETISGGLRVANGSNLNDGTCRYHDSYCGNTGNSNNNRTFLGHKPDGSFLLVCAASAAMSLKVGAKLMCDLGCDYAVNMDGSAAVQMRVASGYTNGYSAGKMTVGGTDYYGACVCVYVK